MCLRPHLNPEGGVILAPPLPSRYLKRLVAFFLSVRGGGSTIGVLGGFRVPFVATLRLLATDCESVSTFQVEDVGR